MIVNRVSCRGMPADAWRCRGQERVFWASFSVGQWRLHTTEKVWDDGLGFEDTALLSLGVGRYQGICAEGNPINGWNVFVSIGEFIHAMKYAGDCRTLLGFEVIEVGGYPRMFWAGTLNLGLLMFVAGGKLFGKFTTDWLDFKSIISAEVFLHNPLLGNSFNAMWEGAEQTTLLQWMGMFSEIATLGLGGSKDFMEHW